MHPVRIDSPDVQTFETEHIAAVRKVAPECMVLLKNDGVLPLSGTGKIALYGSGARRTIKGGTGSGDVNGLRMRDLRLPQRPGSTATTKL